MEKGICKKQINWKEIEERVTKGKSHPLAGGHQSFPLYRYLADRYLRVATKPLVYNKN